MPDLALSFLGAPRIERAGQLQEVDTRKAIALVAYLAVTRQAHSRDTLAALLWPEYDDRHARGALRRTLSVLKAALGGEWLAVANDQVALQRGPGLWIDVERFADAVAVLPGGDQPASAADVARLAEAAALYRDDFLAGFTLRDSMAFDDWQLAQTEALRRDLATVLEWLAMAYRERGEFEAAIASARRWLALDPLHEPAHRQLMVLYLAAGQRSASLRQYSECVRVLQRELGVAPLEETTRLYQEIKENRGPGKSPRPAPGPAPVAPQARPAAEPAAGPGLPPSPGDATPLPFVGRGAEWRSLLAAYAAAGRNGHLVVLEGEAGIGKTRLAEEFLATVRRSGAVVVNARCYQGESDLAYAPFLAVLRAAARQPTLADIWQELPREWLSEAARLLPELRSQVAASLPAAAPLDSPGAQARFYDGISQALAATLAGREAEAGVLWLDDAQWMDAASLDLLAYLVRRLPGHALCLIVAWRSDQVAAGHPLRRLAADAGRAGLATQLTLARLAPAALGELLGKLEPSSARLSALRSAQPAAEANLPAGAPSPSPVRQRAASSRPQPGVGELSARLYRETEGLPFFIAEYLAALASGTLALDAGGWATPEGVRNLIQGRLATVSGAGRQLLSTAAVIGRSFDFETLREISGRSEEETIAGLEELIGQGLIREVAADMAGRASARSDAAPTARPAAGSGPLYDFAHDKLCDVVYQDTSLARRRLLHRRVAEALANRSRLRSGQGEPGRTAGVIAHHHELAGQDGEAAEYYRLAGAYAAGLYANQEALSQYQSALALGHPDQGGLHEAIGDVQTLLGEYGAALRSYETARALSSGEGANGESGPGQGDESITGRGAVTAARLEHKLGMLHLRRGEWEAAAGHLQDALAEIPAGAGRDLRSHMLADWSLAAYRQGRGPEALELARQARALAQEAGDRQALAQAENMLGMLAKHRGDIALACTHLEASLALAEALGDAPARVAALNNLALAQAAGGAGEQALQLMHQALALCSALGDRHREAAIHNNLADLLHARGERDAAMQHLKQAVTIFAGIRVEAGDFQPEIWKLAEW